MLKGRKKKLVDKNAPVRPLNSYNLFLQRRMQEIKEETPGLLSSEMIKMISTEWGNISESDKFELKKEADKMKEEYEKIMTEYKKTKSYKDFMSRLKEHNNSIKKTDSGVKKKARRQINFVSKVENEAESGVNEQHIPIFTNEFLEHNKQRETTLRQLRKQATQLEEETALLSKHVESLESGVKTISQESELYTSKLNQLEGVVSGLRNSISKKLADLVLPSSRERISSSTVEEFLQAVVQYEESHQHMEFVAQVKGKLATIDFSNSL